MAKKYLHIQLKKNDLTDTMKESVQGMKNDFQPLRDEMRGVILRAKKMDDFEKQSTSSV